MKNVYKKTHICNSAFLISSYSWLGEYRNTFVFNKILQYIGTGCQHFSKKNLKKQIFCNILIILYVEIRKKSINGAILRWNNK